MTKSSIVQKLLENNSISTEEAVVLLKNEIVSIPAYTPNPYWTSNPDWTYDPNRPGQPWYTTTSFNTDSNE